MKRTAFIFLPFIFLPLLLLISSCGGSGSGSSSGSGGDAPIVGQDPRNPSSPIDGDNDGDGTDPDAVSYDFGGEYEGPCSVKAMGVTSKTCESSVNIYHDEGGKTLGFMGMIDVDMVFTKASYPVMSAPVNIVKGRLIVEETGEDVGEIDHTGFTVTQASGEYMRFDKLEAGGFKYEGIYHDETYGEVLVEGNLQSID